MKILSAAAIALLLLAGCSSTSTPVPSGMISSSIKIRAIDSWDLYDEIYRDRDRISLIIPFKGVRGGQAISLVHPTYGWSDKEMQAILRHSTGRGSSDGLTPGERNGARWVYFIPKDNSLTNSLESYDGLNQVINELMDSRVLYEPDAVDELLTQCKGRCPSALILGSHFAKANYYDSVNRPLTAAIWRYFALRHVANNNAFIEIHAAALADHFEAVYQYAVEAEDYKMAVAVLTSWADKLYEERRNDRDALEEHLYFWMAQNEKNEEAPKGYTFPLVNDTPLSDYHGVGYRRLAVTEFKIDILAGAIDYAFLDCGRSQVELKVELKRAWQVPSDWGLCDLVIFGEEGTEVRLWELPAGSVDQNGNLSA